MYIVVYLACKLCRSFDVESLSFCNSIFSFCNCLILSCKLSISFLLVLSSLSISTNLIVFKTLSCVCCPDFSELRRVTSFCKRRFSRNNSWSWLPFLKKKLQLRLKRKYFKHFQFCIIFYIIYLCNKSSFCFDSSKRLFCSFTDFVSSVSIRSCKRRISFSLFDASSLNRFITSVSVLEFCL